MNASVIGSQTPNLTFERFSMYVQRCRERQRVAPDELQSLRASVHVLPLVGSSAGAPFIGVVTGIRSGTLFMEAPVRLDLNDRVCIRMPTSDRSAAWVQCRVAAWEPTTAGDCVLQLEYEQVNCPHACKCPLVIFLREGKRTGCPHAGHAGCVQAGPVRLRVKQMLKG